METANFTGDNLVIDYNCVLSNMTEVEEKLIYIIWYCSICWPIDFRTIKATISFVNLGVYSNPVWVSPSLFSIEQNHMVYSKTSKNVLHFSTGMVASCNIVEACKSTPHPASGLVKRIILFTFEGDYKWAINFLGTVLKSPAMIGPCHPSGCLSISTKKEGVNTNISNGESSNFVLDLQSEIFYC